MTRLRHPQTTVRWRLTLLYGGLFLVCGAGLLAITYGLVAHATVRTQSPAFVKASSVKTPPSGTLPPAARASFGPAGPAIRNRNQQIRSGTISVPARVLQILRSSSGKDAITLVGTQQRISDLHHFEVESAIALAIMTVISGLLGWFVAGRVLRPLRTITAATQQISEESLHQRLAIPGPKDELRRLADTIDGLLERLEGAFDAQRRFVANASHELRTPLTVTRAVLEMALADPHADVGTFREACREALEEGEQQELLIDALLALAQGQRGLDARESVDLAGLTLGVLGAHEVEADAAGVHVDASLHTAPLSGDRRLIERLVSNLVENAIHHNVPNGCAEVKVETKAGRATLLVSNTGPPVPAEEVERLLQPFQRLAPDRVGHRKGIGLGLSIVAAIAAAHEATLEIRPGDEGGLEIELRFPSAPEAEPSPPLSDPGPLAVATHT